MQTRMEIVKAQSESFRKAGKRKKGEILDRLVSVTGYNRSYASHLLSLFGKMPVIRSSGRPRRRLVPEAERLRGRLRPVQYGPEVVEPLKILWKVMDYPCGKRLAPLPPVAGPQDGKPRGTVPLFLREGETAGRLRSHSGPPPG